ncbi:MAG: inorganic diphosphatase [Candidatus Dasytiphilus stammeri]
MYLDSILTGENVPHDLNVIIEIPFKHNSIKYEIDKKSGALFVDRFLTTSMFYPCNYGYLNKTLSLDGDPLDTLVIAPSLQPKSIIRCRPVGILKMMDEAGYDFKIIAVPHNKLTTEYDSVLDVEDLSPLLINKLNYFFQHYKDLEKNKWTKIIGWGNSEESKKEILISIERFINSKNQ